MSKPLVLFTFVSISSCLSIYFPCSYGTCLVLVCGEWWTYNNPGLQFIAKALIRCAFPTSLIVHVSHPQRKIDVTNALSKLILTTIGIFLSLKVCFGFANDDVATYSNLEFNFLIRSKIFEMCYHFLRFAAYISCYVVIGSHRYHFFLHWFAYQTCLHFPQVSLSGWLVLLLCLPPDLYHQRSVGWWYTSSTYCPLQTHRKPP